MNRLDIINYLIEKYELKTYLEIGVHVGDVLDGCIAESKLGVDPDCKSYKGNVPIICTTSDEYFSIINEEEKFDLIFIDGMHEAEQVYRDIQNSLLHINEKGYIIVHDCNPPTEWHTRSYEEYKKTGGDWNGDVYKGYINATIGFNCKYITIDTDWGVGIIRFSKKSYSWPYQVKSWDDFSRNRKAYLNLCSPEEFKQWI